MKNKFTRACITGRRPSLQRLLFFAVAVVSALAIQHWVSLRWQSYTVALGFGMCAMLIGIFAIQSTAFGSWFPWSLPIRAVLNGAAGQDRITAIAVAGATVAAIIGCWEFVKREIG